MLTGLESEVPPSVPLCVVSSRLQHSSTSYVRPGLYHAHRCTLGWRRNICSKSGYVADDSYSFCYLSMYVSYRLFMCLISRIQMQSMVFWTKFWSSALCAILLYTAIGTDRGSTDLFLHYTIPTKVGQPSMLQPTTRRLLSRLKHGPHVASFGWA